VFVVDGLFILESLNQKEYIKILTRWLISTSRQGGLTISFLEDEGSTRYSRSSIVVVL
jgi:hypothetical protein